MYVFVLVGVWFSAFQFLSYKIQQRKFLRAGSQPSDSQLTHLTRVGPGSAMDRLVVETAACACESYEALAVIVRPWLNGTIVVLISTVASYEIQVNVAFRVADSSAECGVD